MLLPRYFRIIYLCLVVPIIIVFIAKPDIVFGYVDMQFSSAKEGIFHTKVPVFFESNYNEATDKQEFEVVRMKEKYISNELLLTLILVWVYFISFSRIKNEDEFSELLQL